jgi:ATP-binding cassette subfamily B protein
MNANTDREASGAPATPKALGTAPEVARSVLGELRKVIVFSLRTFRLLWASSPGLTVALFALNTLSSFFPAALLWTTKLVIDAIVRTTSAPNRQGLGVLWGLVFLLAGISVIQSVTSGLTDTLSLGLRFQLEQHTQTLIMRKCGELDIAFFENPKNLDLLENARRSATMGAWTLVWMLLTLSRTGLVLLSFFGILLRLHWLAAAVLAFTTAPQMVVTGYFARRRWMMMTDRTEDRRLQYYISWLTSQPDTAKELRVFGLMDSMIDRFKYYSRKFFLQERGMERRRGQMNCLSSVVSSVGAALIWVYVVLRAISRTIQIGDAVLYIQAVSSCRDNLVSIFAQSGQLYEQTLVLGSLFALLDLDPAKVEGALVGPPRSSSRVRWGSVPAPSRLCDGIEFCGVSFRYPGTDCCVLREVSFSLRAGESAALVGKNGAGKTTLVKLMVRLYDPSDGEILLEGRSLRDYDLASLRRCFGVIFQDFVRYQFTARENIGFGQTEYANDIRRVQTAAHKAGARELLEGLPHKYETYLGRGFRCGRDLSTGEWQKIALARAFMRESPILILDEPTASLDAFAEHEVYHTFGKLVSGRTSFFISHRFATVRAAQHILVLQEGRLVEEGTHEDLMARSGLYSRMFELQAERYR